MGIKKFLLDVKADEELFLARVHGFELHISSWPNRVYAKWVAAIAGFKAGWKSIAKPQSFKEKLDAIRKVSK